jgi:TorA maturation chaperone TorD
MATPTLTHTRADLFRALGVLVEAPGRQHAALAELLGLPGPDSSDWTEAFVVQLVPYASVYLGAEGMLGGEAADRVAGFWRALRLPVPADPDHLAALLGLYATLIEQEEHEPPGARRVLRRQARAALLDEHLASWLLPYTDAMRYAGPPSYAAWADLLRLALVAEVAEVGVADRLSTHLLQAPRLPALQSGLDALIDGLLAPARSGVVITRAHLADAACGRGLAVRLGGRKPVLRALIELEPAGVLDWLAEHARLSAARHLAHGLTAGHAARHWADRAATTATLLEGAASTHKEDRK